MCLGVVTFCMILSWIVLYARKRISHTQGSRTLKLQEWDQRFMRKKMNRICTCDQVVDCVLFSIIFLVSLYRSSLQSWTLEKGWKISIGCDLWSCPEIFDLLWSLILAGDLVLLWSWTLIFDINLGCFEIDIWQLEIHSNQILVKKI